MPHRIHFIAPCSLRKLHSHSLFFSSREALRTGTRGFIPQARATLPDIAPFHHTCHIPPCQIRSKGLHFNPAGKAYAKPGYHLPLLHTRQEIACPSGYSVSLSYSLLFTGFPFRVAFSVLLGLCSIPQAPLLKYPTAHRLPRFCSPAGSKSFGFGV